MSILGTGRAFSSPPVSKPHLPPLHSQRIRPLLLLTNHLTDTYTKCNHFFIYTDSANPKRILTRPSEKVSTQSYDNINGDYILHVNDIIISSSDVRYQVLDLLGQGTFGQVVKCRKIGTTEIYAIKIDKNKPAYFKQGLMETKILEPLNKQYDPDDKHHIVRMIEFFIFRNHLCLVFELLNMNIFELLKQNQYRGLPIVLVRAFLTQILDALSVLEDAGIIHCDLKPENILLANLTSTNIKLIDFGSACFENQRVYSYLQSRFYRSPEVLLGYDYTSAIDIWSLGCISIELFLGLPAFPGSTTFNQLHRIIESRGSPPTYMLERGKSTSKYFDHILNKETRSFVYRIKTEEQYSKESGKPLKPSKRYFDKNIENVIENYPFRRNLTAQQIDEEKQQRKAMIHFITGLLQMDPEQRWSAKQAILHPFITGDPFTGTFNADPTLKQCHINRAQQGSLTVSQSLPQNFYQAYTSPPMSPQAGRTLQIPYNTLGSSPSNSRNNSRNSFNYSPNMGGVGHHHSLPQHQHHSNNANHRARSFSSPLQPRKSGQQPQQQVLPLNSWSSSPNGASTPFASSPYHYGRDSQLGLPLPVPVSIGPSPGPGQNSINCNNNESLVRRSRANSTPQKPNWQVYNERFAPNNSFVCAPPTLIAPPDNHPAVAGSWTVMNSPLQFPLDNLNSNNPLAGGPPTRSLQTWWWDPGVPLPSLLPANLGYSPSVTGHPRHNGNDFGERRG
eukprot:TRINITY_DN17711_c0_g1_i1.p1 TRINITY_DN17711_c0_g1~~TRINITY_DN17711_c0_g1_i1.p1  ORF type:complete len:731 (-),score=93.75 TRINITY_DN17711_c0_g1_i1:241-2433(-)